MNILIDTHILLWALFSPKNLPKKNKTVLLSNKNTVYVSSVSLWEISIKRSINKLDIPEVEHGEFIDSIKKMGFDLLDLTPEEASSFFQLPKLNNKDPFDRMLIWQAIYNDYYLMSHDKKIKEYSKEGLKLV